jgi:hypothetical protein
VGVRMSDFLPRRTRQWHHFFREFLRGWRFVDWEEMRESKGVRVRNFDENRPLARRIARAPL